MSTSSLVYKSQPRLANPTTLPVVNTAFEVVVRLSQDVLWFCQIENFPVSFFSLFLAPSPSLFCLIHVYLFIVLAPRLKLLLLARSHGTGYVWEVRFSSGRLRY